MSYGYQPPEQRPEGSWTEVFLILRVVLGMLLPAMGILFAALLLVTLTLVAFFNRPILALIPLALLGAVIVWLVRRDRSAQEEEERRIFGPRG